MSNGLQKYRVVREPERRLTLRDRVRDLVRAYVLPPLSSSSPEVAAYFRDGLPTSTGLAVNEHTALNYSAVFSAVSLISGDIASLPLQLFKRDGNAKTPYRAHPLYYLLHDQPNPEMTSVVFRQVMQAHALTWGNGYAEIVRDNGGRPAELWPITPDRVAPFRRTAGAPLQYRVSNGGLPETLLDATDVIHLPGLGYDGMCGYSVVHKARETIGLGLATERFGGTFFGNGASFGGVISYKGAKPTDGSQENLIKALNAKHQGVDRAHKFLALYNDATYTRMGIPPDDAQFLETRQFQVSEIARWFNIPPHKLAELERSTHSNIEQQEIEYVIGCLGIWLQKWEQELTVKLIAASELNQQLIEHNVDARLKGDSAARGELYSKLFSVGAITPNQIASKENLPSVDGGDRTFVPLNMIPVDRLDEWVDAQIEAKTAPKTPPNPSPSPTDAAMNRKIEELEAELRDARRIAQEREDAKDLIAAELNDIRPRLEAATREIGRLEGELNDAQDLWDKAEDEAKQLALQLSERCTELATVVTKFETIETQLSVERNDRAVERASGEAERMRLAQHAESLGRDLLTAARDLEQERAKVGELQRSLGEAHTLAAKDAQGHDNARTLIAQLEQERNEARAQTLMEQTRLETLLTGVEAERDGAEDDASASKAQAELLSERASNARRAVRRIAIDLLGFFLERETGRARRAQGSPEKLRSWVQTFYPAQQDVLTSSLKSVLTAAAALEGRTLARETLDEFANEYLLRSQRELLALAAEHDEETLAPALERLLRRWETDRAEQAADLLLGKVA